MNNKNRKYFGIDNVNEDTYAFIEKIKYIPSVKCTFKPNRPYLVIGCALDKEQALIEIYNTCFGFDNYTGKKNKFFIENKMDVNDFNEKFKQYFVNNNFGEAYFYNVLRPLAIS